MTEPTRCPSLADLLDGDTADAGHVANCPRCRALLHAAGAAEPPRESQPAGAGDDETTSRAPTLGGRRRGPLRAGQICTIAFAALDEYLIAVIAETDGADALVAPISDEVDMATDTDLLLEDTVLGYPAMAQAAVAGDVLAEQVHDVLAEGGVDLGHALVRLIDGVREHSQVPLDLPVGPAVTGEEDPRLLFRADEREHAAPFFAPAAMLTEAHTLAELVHHRRHALHISSAEADARLGDAGRLERLERGSLDLEHEVPPPALLALLHDLKIDLHEGTARLVGHAVAGAATDAAAARPPLTGWRAVARRPPEPQPARPALRPVLERHQARAQRYLDALWAAS